MIKQNLKILAFIVVIVLANFIFFGVGLSMKRVEIFNNCMKYHEMLTVEDATLTCQDIMTGDRYAFIERSENKISEEVFK